MKVDERKCVGCGNCVAVCTMGVIHVENAKAKINEDECVECSTCYRVLGSAGLWPPAVRLVRWILKMLHSTFDPPIDVCPTGALVQPELDWPRVVRRYFSDPIARHPSTGGAGRGTEEIKTNDVTGRVGEGVAGFAVELGRPGLGTRFHDIQKMAMGLAELGVTFETKNPVTAVMTNVKTGEINDQVLNEKVLSAIIEFRTEMDRVPEVLRKIDEMQRQLQTVCSIGVASKCGPDGSITHQKVVQEAGYTLFPTGKINLGLGRPAAV